MHVSDDLHIRDAPTAEPLAAGPPARRHEATAHHTNAALARVRVPPAAIPVSMVAAWAERDVGRQAKSAVRRSGERTPRRGYTANLGHAMGGNFDRGSS